MRGLRFADVTQLVTSSAVADAFACFYRVTCELQRKVTVQICVVGLGRGWCNWLDGIAQGVLDWRLRSYQCARQGFKRPAALWGEEMGM